MMLFSLLKRKGAVTATATNDECLGPGITVRVGDEGLTASAGREREAPLARRRQPPLMSVGLHALRRSAFGSRSAGGWGATLILSGRTTSMMAGGEESKAA
jgi:hypothetical protein